MFIVLMRRITATPLMLVSFGLSACSVQPQPTRTVVPSAPPAVSAVRPELAATSLDDEEPEPIVDDLPEDEPIGEQVQPQPIEVGPPPHPLAGLTEAQIEARLKADPASFGSMSIGRPNSGRLLNGQPMKEDPRWKLVDPSHAWGTVETNAYIARAINLVFEEFPGSEPLHIGHISGKHGGRLRPHLSHQSGRDVDLSFFYLNGSHWYQKADQKTLDVKRTWALVRAFITETDVRFILIDRSLQVLLRKHAEAIGEDRAWLDDIFKGVRGKRQALIRHVRGHKTHMHVRFYNPIAQETARRCYKALIKLKLIEAPTHYVWHRAKRGDSLNRLAKRYGSSVAAIRRANGMRGYKIFAKLRYRIPRKGPAPSTAPLQVPPRRLPPPGRVAPAPASASP